MRFVSFLVVFVVCSTKILAQETRTYYVGNNGDPADAFPLPVCAGDCDTDDDCAGDLVCFQRSANEPVRGCTGGDSDNSETDYCVMKETPASFLRPTNSPRPSRLPTFSSQPSISPAPSSNQTLAPSTDTPTLRPSLSSGRLQFVRDSDRDFSEGEAPLQHCQGACATDDDCAEGLVCWERTAGEETRAFGCSGVGGSGLPDMDVCLKPEDMPTSTPTNPPTKAPTFAPNQLLLVSDRGPVAFPLQHCQGNCDSDNDCAEGLVCWAREAGSETRAFGCIGVGGSGLPDMDVCLQPEDMPTSTPTNPPTKAPTFPPNQLLLVSDRGSDAFPLQHCQGECDSDNDCADDLVCWERTEGEETRAWGCAGVGGSGLPDMDVCLKPGDMPTPKPTPAPTVSPTYTPVDVPGGSFKLKMHWEPGFLWQEDDKERFWCISYNYDRSYCWIGRYRSECFDNEMYLEECSDRYWQEFRFIDMENGGEVMISLEDGSGRCWERFRRRVFVTRCDPDNQGQRWIASNGTAFADGPFVLSQRQFTHQCVTSDHHPKQRELVELHNCEFTLGPESRSALWGMYN